MLGDAIEDLHAEFCVGDFAAAEHDGDFDLVSLFEELLDCSSLGVEVAGPDLGSVLHFLDLRGRRFASRLFGSLRRFVLEAVVVHDSTHRRLRIGRNLDEVEIK